MTFVGDDSMSGIELFKTGKFNVVEDCIDKEAKVIDSHFSSIEIVGGCDRVEICHSGANLPEKRLCLA